LVTTYSLEELFAEKTRALHERMRPRDLYDVVQLVENYSSAVDFASARQIFTKKCTAKKIAPPASETLAAQVRASTELEADWKTMLAHQLPALPPLDGIRTRVAVCLAWLDEPVAVAHAASIVSQAPALLAKIRASADEEIVAPPGGTFWGSAGPLELVRFAGSNRLLITFSYHGKHRVVEPYSLRRPRTGNLLLYAWEEGVGHIKAFKVHEMFGIAVTDKTFIPRFFVELSAIA
jgi:Nucleotidyl transferase AbiEii toxin, Type IV TA system